MSAATATTLGNATEKVELETAREIPPREFLDLTSDVPDEGGVQLLREILTTSRKIVVVAGAGISVAAGIPDFRSSKGMFAQMKSKGRSGQMMFDTSVYRSEDTIEEFHDMIGKLYDASQRTQPTPFHNLLEELAKSDRLLRLYTQNIDFLDTRHPNLKTVVPVPAVGPWPKVIAVHGSLAKMTCTKCRIIKDFNPELFRIWKEDTPECNECKKQEDARIAAGRRRLGVGFIRPRMVLYGEPGYDAINIGSCIASDLRNRPDALIVVGTTLKIPGTRTMVKEMSKAIGNRGHIIWLNVDDAPSGEFEDVWDFVIKGDCQKVAGIMQGIPIRPKDQSFVIEAPLSSSQETQKDLDLSPPNVHARSEFWTVVSGKKDDRGNGLLTPDSSLPSTSDDERSFLARKALPVKPKITPVTTAASVFYAPLSSTQNVNTLKRKRPAAKAKSKDKNVLARPTINTNPAEIKSKKPATKRTRKTPLSLIVTLKTSNPSTDNLSNLSNPRPPSRDEPSLSDLPGRNLPGREAHSNSSSLSTPPKVAELRNIVSTAPPDSLEILSTQMPIPPDQSQPNATNLPNSPVDTTSQKSTTSATSKKDRWAHVQPSRRSARLSLSAG